MLLCVRYKKFLPFLKTQKCFLWSWLNKTFNALDENRLKLYGPDRTCAEWILRNGGKVKFLNELEYLADYNKLPPEGHIVYIKEIDASESSIAHYGFMHFKGCKHIDKVILHKCHFLLDEGLPELVYLQDTLSYLEISDCGNITDKGLLSIHFLVNLKHLVLYDLPYVTNKNNVILKLKEYFPNCIIDFF